VTAKSIRKRTFVKDSKPTGGGVMLGYARVSKGDEQNNVLQTEALKAAGCRRIFEEAASGGRWDRPEIRDTVGELMLYSRAISAPDLRPEITLSAISRLLAASSFLRRPPTRPSALAAARPAEVRSRIRMHHLPSEIGSALT
jgi:hypothetical protein